MKAHEREPKWQQLWQGRGERQRQALPLPIVSQWATKLAAKSCSQHSVTKNGCHHRCRV